MASSSEALALATASSASTRAALARSAKSAAFSASTFSGRSSRAAAMPGSNHESRPLTRRNAAYLSRALRAERMARVPPVDAVEHVGELRRRDRYRAISRRRPHESPVLQPLGVQRHADPVMPNNLNQVAPDTSKNVQIAGMRVPAERLLDLQRQSVHATAHVGATDRQPDPNTRRNRDHRRSKTPSTRRSAEACTPPPTRPR